MIIAEELPRDLSDAQAERILTALLDALGKNTAHSDSVSKVVANKNGATIDLKCSESTGNESDSIKLSVANVELSAVLRILSNKTKKIYLLDPGINNKVSLFLFKTLG